MTIPAFTAGPKLLRAQVLGEKTDLTLRSAPGGGFSLSLPKASSDSPTVIVELTYDGSVMGLPVQSL
jgi:hypothetical protein